jgi:hypothetical protein
MLHATVVGESIMLAGGEFYYIGMVFSLGWPAHPPVGRRERDSENPTGDR